MNSPAGQVPATQQGAQASAGSEEFEAERARIVARILRGQGWLRSPRRGVWRDPDELRKLDEKRGAA